MSRLDRYVAAELLVPFVFGVALFLVLLISFDLLYDLLRMVTERGVSLWVAVKVFVYKLPAMVAFTFPMAMLLASILGTGRLAAEGELHAMTAGGVPFWRVMAPVTAVGLGASLLTFGLNESLVPASDALAWRTTLEASQRDANRPIPYVFLKIPEEGPAEVLLYARELVPARREMRDVDLYFYASDRKVREVHARAGVWDATSGLWVLRNVTGADYAPDGTKSEIRAEETTQYQPGKTPRELAHRTQRKVQEMSVRELKAHLLDLERGLQARQTDELRRRRNEARYFLNMRFSVPLAATVFALIGAPLAVRPQRTSSSIGLGIAIVIIFGYYVFTQWMRVVSQDGACPPWVCAWAPNAVGAALGGWLILRESR
jgi:lipopolysaccharide export system permease protein